MGRKRKRRAARRYVVVGRRGRVMRGIVRVDVDKDGHIDRITWYRRRRHSGAVANVSFGGKRRKRRKK